MHKYYFLGSIVIMCVFFLLTGCQTSFLSTPTPDVNDELTEIARSVEKLKQEISQSTPVSSRQEDSIDRPAATKSIAKSTPSRSESPTATNLPLIPTNPLTPSTAPSATQPEPTLTSSPAATDEASPEPATPTIQLATQTLTLNPTAPQAGEVLFKDDFSSRRGWVTNETDTYRLGFSGGGYLIEAKTRSNPIWSVRSKQFEDTLIEVDATQTAGADDGYYGIVCRHQDQGNYYLLIVSADGTFGIGKVKDKELNFLTFTREFANLLNLKNNRIAAGCMGNNLSLILNGEIVLQVMDSDFSSGSVGLVVGNRSTAGTETFFDNFIVYAP